MLSKILKRRNLNSFLINPRFQLTFIAFTMLVAAAITGVYYGTNYFLVQKFIENGKAIGLQPDHPYYRFVAEQQMMMNQVLFVTVATTFLFLLIGGVILSHRVAGPLDRMKNHIENLASGKSKGQFHTRNRDFFPELARAFNAYLKSEHKHDKKVG